jgi:hypothetical protein
MLADNLISSLGRFPTILRAVVDGATVERSHWKPAGGQWSIVEIVTHLADEEAEDFRSRLQLTLDDPAQPWPSIDPEGWAVERSYNSNQLEEVLDRFVSERENSMKWLSTLERVDWSATHSHPTLGQIRSGDLLAAWASHDMLHLRQIVKRLFESMQEDAGEYESRYAGTWKA